MSNHLILLMLLVFTIKLSLEIQNTDSFSKRNAKFKKATEFNMRPRGRATEFNIRRRTEFNEKKVVMRKKLTEEGSNEFTENAENANNIIDNENDLNELYDDIELDYFILVRNYFPESSIMLSNFTLDGEKSDAFEEYYLLDSSDTQTDLLPYFADKMICFTFTIRYPELEKDEPDYTISVAETRLCISNNGQYPSDAIPIIKTPGYPLVYGYKSLPFLNLSLFKDKSTSDQIKYEITIKEKLV